MSQKKNQTTNRLPRPSSTKRGTNRKTTPSRNASRRVATIGLALEIISLTVAGILATVVLLGHGSRLFSGTSLFRSLLPFAFSVLGIALLGIVFFSFWQRLKKHLQARSLLLPGAVALTLATIAALLITVGPFHNEIQSFRTLVGGRQEASRNALSHQVYAAYRRLDEAQIGQLLKRATPFQAVIAEAADHFSIDPHLLLGLAAVESSFIPRTSEDGGEGLFQITKVPETSKSQAAKIVPRDQQELGNHRYNAYLAAATLKHYLKEMRGDLFLGLLAYNIGPRNGGLRFIMEKYHAATFVEIQPYLQDLPRDYPIKVLSYALAFRVQKRTGSLLAYEEGKNAVRIQSMGIPGL
ncbi:lytic transglycosylase domain-containing protein [Desulfofustis limnaeus]|uniref:lytic transglycosylase domain-containing protein n=1 Tax=Desulfofustis limnaeus TaxID=2740163 RepID=UPI0024DF8638|nr:lytic transglycosylase domain-containing protein [Desulfofustis limnaeus]